MVAILFYPGRTEKLALSLVSFSPWGYQMALAPALCSQWKLKSNPQQYVWECQNLIFFGILTRGGKNPYTAHWEMHCLGKYLRKLLNWSDSHVPKFLFRMSQNSALIWKETSGSKCSIVLTNDWNTQLYLLIDSINYIF